MSYTADRIPHALPIVPFAFDNEPVAALRALASHRISRGVFVAAAQFHQLSAREFPEDAYLSRAVLNSNLTNCADFRSVANRCGC